MVLSLLTGAVMLVPQQAIGQSASYPRQNGPVMWHGTQQQSGAYQRIRTGLDNRQARQQVAPGYLQHPVASQSALRGANRPTTDDPAADNRDPANQRSQSGQFPSTTGGAEEDPQSANQQARDEQAARWRAQQGRRKRDPFATPALSPAATRFFQDLRGPNLSTWNQNRSNYSFVGQTRPDNRIPNTTWRSGSRFGQSYSNRSVHNQTTFNQNRFNYSLHNIAAPGLRGYR